MRRVELAAAVIEIVNALEKSKLVDALLDRADNLRKSPDARGEFPTNLFGALYTYAIEANNYSNAANDMSDILGLSNLTNPQMWQSISAIDEPGSELFAAIKYIKSTLDYLPKFNKLIQQDLVEEISSKSENLPKEFQNKSILSVILIEEKGMFSSPNRIIEIFEAISLLYESCATVLNTNSMDLIVLACDSGSDKAFDFLGLAKVVEQVKDIIISVWDRVVFYRENKLSERLNLIAESLPIIDYIGTLESQGKMGAEQAELLRRNILKGTNKFLSSGAIIPEIEEKLNYTPRSLMTPEPKLLVEPRKESKKKSEEKDKEISKKYLPDLSILDEDEKDTFRKILDKISSQQKSKEESANKSQKSSVKRKKPKDKE